MSEFTSVIQLSALDGTNGFRINGEAPGDDAGFSVASAGDVNGDGFADVIVGAFLADPNGEQSGASYVIFGQQSGFPADLELSALDGSNGFQINGEAAFDRSGRTVASAGDINGDGFADLIIGAYRAGPNGDNSGASYVVFGKASGFSANVELSALDGTNGFQINGEGELDFSGHSVASAGDVNGDGIGDLLIGAVGADPNGLSSGATYVVFGKTSGFSASLELSALDGSNGFQINGETAGDNSGTSVASAGDVNGDGVADLIIGADSAGVSSGASYVVFGKITGFAANLELSALDGSNGFQINGEADFDSSGLSVASAGDINGDGFADLLIGAPYADINGDESGAAYVVFGKASGFSANLDLSALDGSNGFQISGEAAGDKAGFSVAAAGDVNGDGFADFIIGAYGATPNGPGSGASYVVFGKASGFPANFDLSRIDGNNGFKIAGEPGHSSGDPVAAAGDVNGDGFADLIIGALGSNPGGGSHVIFGHRALEAVNRVGTDLAQTINGGFGDDRIAGLGGNDRLLGWEGDDTINGGDGNDFVFGDIGNDRINTGTGNNVANGGAGNDQITGLEGRDVLVGGTGNDTLSGGLGNDNIRAGAGDDLVFAGLGNDTVSGDAGIDTLSFVTVRGSGGVTADMTTGLATIGAETTRFSGIERLEGTVEADALTGDSLANTLTGLAGKDTLSGGAGNDTLTGGVSADVLTGGGGNDVFDFNALTESSVGVVNRDVIADFDTNGDVIDLSTIDAISGGTDDAFAFIGTAAFTALGQVRVFQQGGNTFIDVNAIGDTRPDMRIELTDLVALDAGDIVL